MSTAAGPACWNVLTRKRSCARAEVAGSNLNTGGRHVGIHRPSHSRQSVRTHHAGDAAREGRILSAFAGGAGHATLARTPGPASLRPGAGAAARRFHALRDASDPALPRPRAAGARAHA